MKNIIKLKSIEEGKRITYQTKFMVDDEEFFEGLSSPKTHGHDGKMRKT